MITPLELDDDAELDRAYQIKTACEPGPHEGLQRFRSLLRFTPAGDRQWAWRADEDGFALVRADESSPDARARILVTPDAPKPLIGTTARVLGAPPAGSCRCRLLVR